MIKRKIAAVIMAALTAMSAGCGNKINDKNGEQTADSTAESSSQAESAAESSAAVNTPAADSKAVSEDSTAPASDGGEVVPGITYIKRAESSSSPVTDDVKKPPENSAELNVLISMEPVTNYVRAAEVYLSQGGKIKVVKTPKDALYDQISAETVAGKHIDIAQFDNGMMFPYGATQGLIMPTDYAIDYTAARWDECRKLSEAFNINNWHYVAAFGSSARNVLYYSKRFITAGGYEDPAELYKNGKWTTEKFCDMLRKWGASGGMCGVAGHDVEQGLSMGSGKSLITYDHACGGFSNSVYDPDICVAMNYIYGLKYEGLIGSTAYDIPSAFREGALFWSGTLAEGEAYTDKDTLGAVPFPTLTGRKADRCYAAEYDGLVLLKNTKNLTEARAYFECVREQEHAPEGTYAKKYTAGTPIYEYGMGISPKVSDNEAGANGDFDKAIIPLMYTEGPELGDWDDVVCYGLSFDLNHELIAENNEIADKIFGRSKEKERKVVKKTEAS